MTRIKIKFCLLQIIFFTAVCQQSFAQSDKVVDSLMNELKGAKEDTNKVNTLINLSDRLSNISEYAEAIKYASTGLVLSEKLKFNRGIASSYNLIGISSRHLGNYAESLKNHQLSLKMYEAIGDKRGMADAYHNMGRVQVDMGNHSDPFRNYNEAIKFYQEIDDKKDLAETYADLGLITQTKGNWPKAVEYYLTCLKISEAIGNKLGMANALINLANIYDYQNKTDQALKNYRVALKLAEELNDKSLKGACYMHIGIVYINKGNFNEAIKYNMASLKIREEIGDKTGVAHTYHNIGEAYQMNGNYTEALKYYQLAVQKASEIGYKGIMIVSSCWAGYVSTELKKYQEARQHFEYSLALSKESGGPGNFKAAYEGLARLDSATGNFKLAYEHQKLNTAYSDSVINESSNNQIAQLKEQYESEKKDQEIKMLNKEKAIQILEIKKQKQTKNYFISGLIVFAVLSFFVYRNFQNQRKLNKLYKVSAEKQMAELQLQSLRAQLNPHFMFNSLNAIQELIVMEENEKSQSYLERFAQLLRQLLDNANLPFISLRKEIGFLDLYLSLEKLRLPDLQYSIKIDPQLNLENFVLPNMMLQPYIENALWHGLQHKQGEKKLQLHVTRQNGSLQYEIKDNGVGRKKAEELKTLYRKEHRSKGMELLSQRFDLLSQEYGQKIQTKITDLTENDNAAGTLVEITVPVSLSEQNQK